MNCLQNLPRSYLVLPKVGAADPRGPPPLVVGTGLPRGRLYHNRAVSATNMPSSSISSTESGKSGVEAERQKSDIYSNTMTHAMGAVLTYRHELGMNYNFILPDLIVGSCLQSHADVDKLRKIGVKTIFCLQQDPDLEYFGVDISAIQEYAKKFRDIKHYRAEIRDFDAFDLRMRLPAVVSELHHAVKENGGVTYIHCTAGLGRAPAVALAYMFWIREYKLSDAHELLLRKRPCFPKLEAIKGATADIITGLSKNTIRLMWDGGDCTSVEVSGLDIGWGQRIPLNFDEAAEAWVLEKELPEGKYEYKYIVDGEWTVNEYEQLTQPNGDGHINNCVHVHDIRTTTETRMLRERLMSEDVDLLPDERQIIREYLEHQKQEK